MLLSVAGETGFAWDAEVVALALALGINVQEVPIEWHHDDRSKVKVLRDGGQMVAAIPRIREADPASAGRPASPRSLLIRRVR